MTNVTKQIKSETIQCLVKLNTGILADEIIPFSESSGEFHHIFLIKFADGDQKDLVLRISKPWIGSDKTRNEVAFMKWVGENIKSCPVPEVVDWSDDANSSLIGHDYTLLSLEPGVELASVWNQVDMEFIIQQSAQIYAEMAGHSTDPLFARMGGLVAVDNKYLSGPWIEETTYTIEEFGQCLAESGLTLKECQVGGPFSSFSDFVDAELSRTLKIIQAYSQTMKLPPAMVDKDIITKIRNVKSSVVESTQLRDALDNMPFCVHHNDFHLHNILVDPSSSRITAILDWELATVAPVDQWIRRNTFWAKTVEGAQALEWQNQLRKEIGRLIPHLVTQASDCKEHILKFMSLAFWIVKCTVLQTQADDVVEWVKLLEAQYEAIQSFI